jgi:hypothetical protein
MASKGLSHIKRGGGWGGVGFKSDEGVCEQADKRGKKEIIQSAITYFTNHLHQMNYRKYLQNNWPIGSGVIEAACKVIVKQRLCNSGMKWTDYGAKTVLALRCFNKSDGMWEQFWNKVNRYGK